MNSILLCHNSIIYLMHDKKVEFGSRLLNRVYGNKYVHSLYHTKDFQNGTCQPCPVVDIKKGEKQGECLCRKHAQLILCTVVIYDKGGTFQRAGCLVTGCQIRMAS